MTDTAARDHVAKHGIGNIGCAKGLVADLRELLREGAVVLLLLLLLLAVGLAAGAERSVGTWGHEA